MKKNQSWTWFWDLHESAYCLIHSGPKMPKSKPWGECPKFICHLNKGHIVISKYKIFFRSVGGNFKQNSNGKVIEFSPSPLRWTVWYNFGKNSEKMTILSTIVSFIYFWLCSCKIKYQTLSKTFCIFFAIYLCLILPDTLWNIIFLY